jgi:hypothetical protein
MFKAIQYSKIFKDSITIKYCQSLSNILPNGVPLGLTGGEWSLATRAVEENVLFGGIKSTFDLDASG